MPGDEQPRVRRQPPLHAALEEPDGAPVVLGRATDADQGTVGGTQAERGAGGIATVARLDGRGAVRHDHRRVRLAVERPDARGVARGAGDDDVAPADERALERRDTSRRRAADDVRLDGVGVVGDEDLGRQQREPAAGGAELHLHDVRARQSAEETSEPAAPRLQRQQRLAQRRVVRGEKPERVGGEAMRAQLDAVAQRAVGRLARMPRADEVTLAPFAARPSATPRSVHGRRAARGAPGRRRGSRSSPARPPCVGRDPSGGGDSARGDHGAARASPSRAESTGADEPGRRALGRQHRRVGARRARRRAVARGGPGRAAAREGRRGNDRDDARRPAIGTPAAMSLAFSATSSSPGRSSGNGPNGEDRAAVGDAEEQSGRVGGAASACCAAAGARRWRRGRGTSERATQAGKDTKKVIRRRLRTIGGFYGYSMDDPRALEPLNEPARRWSPARRSPPGSSASPTSTSSPAAPVPIMDQHYNPRKVWLVRNETGAAGGVGAGKAVAERPPATERPAGRAALAVRGQLSPARSARSGPRPRTAEECGDGRAAAAGAGEAGRAPRGAPRPPRALSQPRSVPKRNERNALFAVLTNVRAPCARSAAAGGSRR